MVLSDAYSALFGAVTISFIAGAAISLVFKQGGKASTASFSPAIAGSALLIVFSIIVATSGAKIEMPNVFHAAIPAMSINLYIDGMAAFFMLILGLITFAVSIYSIGYSKQYSGKRSLRSLGFLFNLFAISMLLVIASNSVFSFLIFWELMSLASFFLVIYEHEDELNIKSGLTYIVMTHIGTAFILASFLALFFQTGS